MPFPENGSQRGDEPSKGRVAYHSGTILGLEVPLGIKWHESAGQNGVDGMRSLRILLTGSLCFVSAVGLEFWVYPWAVYFGNFTYGFGSTLASYLIVALVVGVVASAASFSLSLYRSMPAVGQALMTGVSMLTALCVFGLILGPFGLDIPGTRARGIFFSEWKFMTFATEVSAPASILAGLVAWLIVRREQRILRAAVR